MRGQSNQRAVFNQPNRGEDETRLGSHGVAKMHTAHPNDYDDCEPIACEISSDGQVRIVVDCDHVAIGPDYAIITLDPDQALACGDFFHATEGLWRP